MAGRKKIPDELKALKGTLQPCRATDNGDALERLTAVGAPKWLTTQAKKIFVAKANQLMSIRVLTEFDVDLLALYANSYSLIMDAAKQINSQGQVNAIYNDEGNIVSFVVNPYFKIMNDNVKVVNQLGSQFGFSPSSRSSIMASVVKTKPKDDFDDFD